ncbi:[LysW]-aminoadipate kinase [Actinophytocola oryzae]|uniref:[LysW]-aminoadipate kinase n=1 Tax=Actinophytocola oryzae TaxID=502181 RepID=UPI001FB8BA20|nr:[LysW]-aminoadipate kinase [Actinophytocola oryzae]
MKLGGALDDEMTRACADVRTLVSGGAEVVVVHGGGAAADRVGTELGRPTRHLTSRDGRRSRYTDAAALDTLMLGILGRVKPTIVTALASLGVRAVGLSGLDGGMVTATRNRASRAILDGMEVIVRDDLSGRLSDVDASLPNTLLAAGFVPVISPPALSTDGPLNVDADRLAAALAVALSADTLVVLSNVPGLLRDRHDPASLITSVPVDAPEEYLALAEGRMKVKLRAAVEARRAGVGTVVLADGRTDSPVLTATGTRFVTREEHHARAS